MRRPTLQQQIQELRERLVCLEACLPKSTESDPGEATCPDSMPTVESAERTSSSDSSAATVIDLQPVLEPLARIEAALQELQKDIRVALGGATSSERTSYTTAEAATILGKAEYTVREWCRLERVHATREKDGRGGYGSWRISREELVRIQNEGLLPDPRKH
jgi:hypothetical protein